MMEFDARSTTTTIVEAVRGLDRRVVLLSGWTGLGDADLPSNVRAVKGFVPHAWLCPRAACVVHQGGSGSTAAGFRAGVPPDRRMAPQRPPRLSAEITQLGVGPPPRSQRNLESACLREALDRALSDEAMAMRARTLGVAIRQEDGTGIAVRAIEQALASSA
jgi:UDP:flavonoid glycosyltransferase YjiC (YdhE family)